MKLNCRPGDLAVYVGRDIREYGRFVRIVARDTEAHERFFGDALWITEPSLTRDDGLGPVISTADRALRPITPPAGSVTREEVDALYAPKAKEPFHA
jgi:hypothetical protein